MNNNNNNNNNYNNYNDQNGYDNNNNYNNQQQYSEQYYEEPAPVYEQPVYYEPPKKKGNGVLIAIIAILSILILGIGGYFGYTKFAKTENIVKLSEYEINFVTFGNDGEGKPSVDIKKTPSVKNSDEGIKEFLNNPTISYDKKDGLKNGDKVEVTITLSKASAKSMNLTLEGDFKQSFTVSGLPEKTKEKEKETIIVKESNSSSSSNRVNNEQVKYVVPDAGVNLRSNKTDSSSIIKTAKVGSRVRQYYTETNSSGEVWSWVEYDGSYGWMRSDLIR